MQSPRRLAALFALVVPSGALAESVYLNGTRVDGLTNTKIDKCAVEFDAKANVLLTCPGYSVKVEGVPAKAPAPAEAPSKHYFLVSEQSVVGATDFDIDVFVNSKFYRRMRSQEEPYVGEITRLLSPGKNAITFVARKRTTGSRKSFSPEHFFRITVGEGAEAHSQVMIDNPLLTYQRTAADAADDSQELTLTAR
jgi:hypothetical protein